MKTQITGEEMARLGFYQLCLEGIVVAASYEWMLRSLHEHLSIFLDEEYKKIREKRCQYSTDYIYNLGALKDKIGKAVTLFVDDEGIEVSSYEESRYV